MDVYIVLKKDHTEHERNTGTKYYTQLRDLLKEKVPCFSTSDFVPPRRAWMRSLKKCSTVLSHGNGLERRVQRVVASFGGDNEGGVASVLGLDEQRGEVYAGWHVFLRRPLESQDQDRVALRQGGVTVHDSSDDGICCHFSMIEAQDAA